LRRQVGLALVGLIVWRAAGSLLEAKEHPLLLEPVQPSLDSSVARISLLVRAARNKAVLPNYLAEKYSAKVKQLFAKSSRPELYLAGDHATTSALPSISTLLKQLWRPMPSWSGSDLPPVT